MEDRHYGMLWVFVLFLNFSLCVGQTENLDEEGSNKQNSSLKCHPVLTAILEGTVLNSGDLSAGEFIFSKDYYESVNSTHFRVCICMKRPCLRKCCNEDEIYVNKTCMPHTSQINPDVFDLNNNLLPGYNLSKFYRVYGDTCPSRKFLLDPDSEPEDRYFFRTDGTLLVPGGIKPVIYESDFFCFENLGRPENLFQGVLVCFPDSDTDPEHGLEYAFYPIGMIISIPFLLATFLVYALIPELRNLHGKNSMCHVISLLTAYVFLAIIQLSGSEIVKWFCVVAGYTVQFSFLATFFWLNVMSFDIWWAFSGFRNFGGHKGSAKERELRRFIIYSCYAWGGPALLLAVSLALDYSPNVPDYILRPEIGELSCFFKTKMASLAYFYAPVAVLLVSNIVLFLSTAIKIFIIKKETQVLSGNESRRNDEGNKQRFVLYLKLFIVMGINWLMEVLSWAIGGQKNIWYLTDICNTLQGVFIFLIFVCKARIKKLIMMKFCPHLIPQNLDNTMSSSLKMSMSRNSSTAIALNESTTQVNSTPVGRNANSNDRYK